ncbi:MAG TPA: 4Fe-4S binding protein [Syntrophomonadaceae bacterium]|nr:4Fe-4S binding protein [Syntrophomonadaceae bacterium]HPR92441.1 4Fe-4S binding protein [Syntrophomonadaceae bacterium]
MIYVIVPDKCSSCGLCADVCPVEAISQIGPYSIDTLLCIACGACYDNCPCMAIEIYED